VVILGFAITSAVIGAYQQCCSTRYEPHYSGTTTQCIVINPPRSP